MADFVSEDTKPYLEITCIDHATKLPVDLTGQTIQLRFKIGNGGMLERMMTIFGAASNGVVRYQFLAGELTAGLLVYEATIIDATTLELTSRETGSFDVRARIE